MTTMKISISNLDAQKIARRLIIDGYLHGNKSVDTNTYRCLDWFVDYVDTYLVIENGYLSIRHYMIPDLEWSDEGVWRTNKVKEVSEGDEALVTASKLLISRETKRLIETCEIEY